jgi:hypothetical protein
MKAYVGQTRSRRLLQWLINAGYGECTNRSELPPRRHPWFYDNGAFSDWKSGKEFDAEAFKKGLEFIQQYDRKPDFIVAPDIVAGGQGSLERSVAWRERVQLVAPAYLAVQDGMREGVVEKALGLFDGIFIGGTLSWKVKTGEAWVNLAHAQDKPCHAGRVGTKNRVRWALRVGIDSIDSCFPLWSERSLQEFHFAMRGRPEELFTKAVSNER